MEKTLLEKVLAHDIKGVIQDMILPSRDFVGNKYEYDFDFNREALDRENLLVRIHKFMERMLDFDDFTDEVNKFIAELDEENKYNTMFDYALFEQLKIVNDNVELDSQDYTYNDTDYCRLDRDIHYTVFKNHEENEYYVIMAVHYGADARAGFSDFVCFKIDELEYFYHGMTIQAWDLETDEDVEIYELDSIATYNKENNTWIHNETNNEIVLYTSADGY